LAARISEERRRLALAKERMRQTSERNSESERNGESVQPSILKSMPQNRNRPEISVKPKTMSLEAPARQLLRHTSEGNRVSDQPAILKPMSHNKKKSTERSNRLSESNTNQDSEFEKRLHQLTTREAAYSAKLQLAEKKGEYLETQVASKENMCSALQNQINSLKSKLSNVQSQLETANTEKLNLSSDKDIARTRLKALSETSTNLEKQVHFFKVQYEDASNQLREVAKNALIKENRLEAELLESRASMKRNSDLLQQLRSTTESSEMELKHQLSRGDMASSKLRTIENELSNEREAHLTAGQALEILKLENNKLRQRASNAEMALQSEGSSLKEVTDQLHAERERSVKVESALKETFDQVNEELMQTRLAYEKTLDRSEEAFTRARDSQESEIRKSIQYEEKITHLTEQLARATLNNNAQADMYEQQILDMKSKPKQSTPKSAPVISTGFVAMEELVVDVDLPTGECVELVLKSTDDAERVISRFASTYALSPRVSQHLNHYVKSQLSSIDSNIPFHSPKSKPPPPPSKF